MDEDILAMLLIALVIFVPVAGFTLRFALKPMVDSIARLLEVRAGTNNQVAMNELLERRVALLEQELRVVRGEVTELSERSDFYERLGTSSR